MTDQPRKRKKAKNRTITKVKTVKGASDLKTVIEFQRVGEEAQKDAYAAMVSNGMDEDKALAIAFPEMEVNAEAIRCMNIACSRRMKLMQAAKQEGLQQLGSINRRFVMDHLKDMFLTPLAEIDANSIYCRKHEVKTAMTDNGPVTVTKIEKDSPLAILKTIADLEGMQLPTQGSKDALELEAAKLKEHQNQGDTMRMFLAGLVDHGAPFMRPVRDVEAVPQNPVIDSAAELPQDAAP